MYAQPASWTMMVIRPRGPPGGAVAWGRVVTPTGGAVRAPIAAAALGAGGLERCWEQVQSQPCSRACTWTHPEPLISCTPDDNTSAVGQDGRGLVHTANTAQASLRLGPNAKARLPASPTSDRPCRREAPQPTATLEHPEQHAQEADTSSSPPSSTLGKCARPGCDCEAT